MISSEPLPNVRVLKLPLSKDKRGDFRKSYNIDQFKSAGLIFNPAEIFISTSKKNVIRGMHFQLGGSAHEKLITVVRGRALDIIVDVRSDSEFYNKPFSIELKEDEPYSVLIGKGYAHGFLTLEDNTTMQYATSTVYNKEKDCGIHWSSINFKWPISNPILSERDQSHLPIGFQKSSCFDS